MMKICFCSSLYLNENELARKTKTQLGISSHKLISNMIDGFEKNESAPCHLINIPEIPSYPRCKKVIFNNKKWKHNSNLIEEDIEVGFLNIIGVKYVIQIYRLVKYLKVWIKNHKEDQLIICSYGRRFSHVIAINYIKRKYPSVTTCAVLGDLSGKFAGDITVSHKNSIKSFIINRLLDYQVNQALNFDCFVLVTKYMAEALKLKKPYCVVEGISENKSSVISNVNEENKKIIVYAGALEIQYNILDLIEAFNLIGRHDYELWLFGNGSAAEQVREEARKNNKIHYFGAVTSDEVTKAYMKATVLVNPRKNTGLYTKYSFPSKTMEFLASGKPVIGYRLDGIPDEYENYIFFVENNTVQALSDMLLTVCEKSEKEKKEIGESGKKFVLEQKSAEVQCKKIMNLFALFNEEKA